MVLKVALIKQGQREKTSLSRYSLVPSYALQVAWSRKSVIPLANTSVEQCEERLTQCQHHVGSSPRMVWYLSNLLTLFIGLPNSNDTVRKVQRIVGSVVDPGFQKGEAC